MKLTSKLRSPCSLAFSAVLALSCSKAETPKNSVDAGGEARNEAGLADARAAESATSRTSSNGTQDSRAPLTDASSRDNRDGGPEGSSSTVIDAGEEPDASSSTEIDASAEPDASLSQPTSSGDGGDAGAPSEASCICSNGDACDLQECPPGPSGHVRVVEVAAGWGFSCARSESGRIYCWGESTGGTLGDGLELTTHQTLTATAIAGVVGAKKLAAAGWNACIVNRDDEVRCWGTNSFDQLEIDASLGGSATPVGLKGVSSKALDVAIGFSVDGPTSHGCVVTSDSAVRCWGNNAYYQLGTADVARSDVALTSPELLGFRRAVASGMSSCGLTIDGAVECWGARVYGQLGDGLGGGTAEASANPVAALGLTSGVIDLASSSRAACAVTESGGVKCWGSPGQGALGVGDDVGIFAGAASTPVDVVGLPGAVSKLAAGHSHFCALIDDGSVWCWGAGFDTSPAPVDGLEVVAAMGAGQTHTCVAPVSGGVMCWGTGVGTGSASTGIIETPQYVDGL